MSKWRPDHGECLYVISDIHGDYDGLQMILSRILPLRTTGGRKDKIVFLGDYIDRKETTHLVLDEMVRLKNQYGDNVITLMGNHELMLLEVLNLVPQEYLHTPSLPNESKYQWLINGGYQTALGYINRAGIECDPFDISSPRLQEIIGSDHLIFLMNLLPYHETDDYVFVHAGCSPKTPLKYNDLHTLTWDRLMFAHVKDMQAKGKDVIWEKPIITGHNHDGPFVTNKFMMLDCDPNIIVVELNSMEAFLAQPGKDRLVKYDLQEARSK